MSSRPRRAEGRGPFRRAGAGWAIGLAAALGTVATGGVLFVATAREARADEDSDLREEFVKGGPGRWQAVLKDLARSPARTGIVLGPVFRDRSVRSSSA